MTTRSLLLDCCSDSPKILEGLIAVPHENTPKKGKTPTWALGQQRWRLNKQPWEWTEMFCGYLGGIETNKRARLVSFFLMLGETNHQASKLMLLEMGMTTEFTPLEQCRKTRLSDDCRGFCHLLYWLSLCSQQGGATPN